MRKTDQHTRLRILGVVVAVAVACAASSCGGPGPEDHSGRDTQRAGAQQIPLETAVTDALNFEGGDATDWKVFEIPSPDTYTLEFYWDAPFVHSSVALHDQYGTLLQALTHTPGQHHDVLTVDLREAGLHYIRIHSDMYRTTYSIRVYEGQLRAPEDWQTTPIPELESPI